MSLDKVYSFIDACEEAPVRQIALMCYSVWVTGAFLVFEGGNNQ
ncbi:MAG: hypothetical protein QW717_07325 [Candidatus Bathyarchaeia archaeon]